VIRGEFDSFLDLFWTLITVLQHGSNRTAFSAICCVFYETLTILCAQSFKSGIHIIYQSEFWYSNSKPSVSSVRLFIYYRCGQIVAREPHAFILNRYCGSRIVMLLNPVFTNGLNTKFWRVVNLYLNTSAPSTTPHVCFSWASEICHIGFRRSSTFGHTSILYFSCNFSPRRTGRGTR
jgi:hypothetical protein